MPSGITHVLLTKQLQDYLDNGQLKNIIAFAADSFQVGAVGPDLPYTSLFDNNILSSEINLADDFHYKFTNQIPLQSFRRLRELNGQVGEEIHYHLFAFFLGYASHVFADGIIHPFIRDMVGEYIDHKAEHRSLEMQLDVLFFEELTKDTGFNLELNYTDIHDEIEDFYYSKFRKDIVNEFKSLIQTIYHQNYSTRKISGWIRGLHRMFGLAEGNFPRYYRNLRINTFSFRNLEDINREEATILTRPEDREINFLKVDTIDYFKDCIPQFRKQFIPFAQKAFSFVYDGGMEITELDIPEINLDTGRILPENDLDTIPAFWLDNK